MVQYHNGLLAGNGDRWSVMRKREYLPCHRANREQNDKEVRFSPSEFVHKEYEDATNLNVK